MKSSELRSILVPKSLLLKPVQESASVLRSTLVSTANSVTIIMRLIAAIKLTPMALSGPIQESCPKGDMPAISVFTRCVNDNNCIGLIMAKSYSTGYFLYLLR